MGKFISISNRFIPTNKALGKLRRCMAKQYTKTLIARHGEAKLISGINELSVNDKALEHLIEIAYHQELVNSLGALKGEEKWRSILLTSFDQNTGLLTNKAVAELDSVFESATPRIMDAIDMHDHMIRLGLGVS